MRKAELDDALLSRIRAVVRPGDEITTLTSKRPNVIAGIDRDGIWVETLRSKSNGSGPQLVPAWMIEVAWNQLQKNGFLSQTELLRELNVKRSAFVMALLARFSDVDVHPNGPNVIELIGGQKP